MVTGHRPRWPARDGDRDRGSARRPGREVGRADGGKWRRFPRLPLRKILWKRASVHPQVTLSSAKIARGFT